MGQVNGSVKRTCTERILSELKAKSGSQLEHLKTERRCHAFSLRQPRSVFLQLHLPDLSGVKPLTSAC